MYNTYQQYKGGLNSNTSADINVYHQSFYDAQKDKLLTTNGENHIPINYGSISNCLDFTKQSKSHNKVVKIRVHIRRLKAVGREVETVHKTVKMLNSMYKKVNFRVYAVEKKEYLYIYLTKIPNSKLPRPSKKGAHLMMCIIRYLLLGRFQNMSEILLYLYENKQKFKINNFQVIQMAPNFLYPGNGLGYLNFGYLTASIFSQSNVKKPLIPRTYRVKTSLTNILTYVDSLQGSFYSQISTNIDKLANILSKDQIDEVASGLRYKHDSNLYHRLTTAHLSAYLAYSGLGISELVVLFKKYPIGKQESLRDYVDRLKKIDNKLELYNKVLNGDIKLLKSLLYYDK